MCPNIVLSTVSSLILILESALSARSGSPIRTLGPERFGVVSGRKLPKVVIAL